MSLARVLSWIGLTMMVGALWLGQSGSSQARLDPYYIVRGQSFGTITPRVLFVLDTSGSMSRRANEDADKCRWSRCESPDWAGTDEESRLSAARRGVREVVAGAGEAAQFSFMTFVQNGAETDATPDRCTHTGEPTRFAFGPDYRDWQNPTLEARRSEPGSTNDYAGALRLCQGNGRRPYAYIRWDQLGVGSVIGANNAVGAVPASPLISLAQADYTDSSNLLRNVQFFPTFMGIRAQLNATTDPDQTVLNATVGDYDRTDVWGQDFYYWPYVDGFSGYGAHDIGYDNGSNGLDDRGTAGVAGDEDYFAGVQLHSPFYIDLSATAIAQDDWGPVDEDAALETVLAQTAPLIEGGVDAVGNTPWASAVGVEPGTPAANNSAGSHASIASYLAFLSTTATATACAPVSVVLMTDGEPSNNQGGSLLNGRLAALRNDLGASVYVVGFFLGTGGQLNDMACAAAGACEGTCGSPCDDTPADDWDTCQDPADPENTCAYVASSTEELQAILASIIDQALEVEVESGPGAVANDFGAFVNDDGDASTVQTTFAAQTDYPGWQGHVTRRYCTTRDADDELLPACTPPVPEFQDDNGDALEFETFGPCDEGRDWDAGECLQLTPWNERRIYSHDASNNMFRISAPDGTASAEFVAELAAQSIIEGGSLQDQADEIVAFILGRDAVDGWKLPGISHSAPITVRRIPQYDSSFLPEVGIRDPHCAGRRFGELDAGTLPDSLENFAQDAWQGGPDYTYQEAVVVGDDFGIIHAFHLDSGNELFGVLPRFGLANASQQAAHGPLNMGQPAEDDLEEHLYGVASTLNHGWVYDEGASRWRHLGVIGMGAGGNELIALDFSHMNPDVGIPVEVLWTTDDDVAGRRAEYDTYLGETWARPALSYHVTGDQIGAEPSSFLVFGSGYRDEGVLPTAEQGRVLIVADAITGDILENAAIPVPTGDVYEENFGSVVDPAVSSHCLSRYWAEAQETYIADPAGRLFRWDLGRGDATLEFKHDADSGGAPWAGEAVPVATFPACTGTGTTCTVRASNPGDPFVFAPAVSAFNRIDDVTAGAVADVTENDQFLIALVSGGPNETTLDGGDEDNDFHTSLYLLADNHTSGVGDGFNIPNGTPVSGGSFGAGDAVSGNPGYMRISVTDVERTRTVTPYEGAPTFSETRRFSKAARPVRAPRIYITGVVEDEGGIPLLIEDVEVYYVTYSIYEPGSGECDPRFYDSGEDEWQVDRGSTYDLTFRLTADAVNGFEFNSGSSGGASPVDFAPGFDSGLQLVSVEQERGDDCPSGNCGAEAGAPASVPCDNNNYSDTPAATQSYAVPLTSRQLTSFSPVEG